MDKVLSSQESLELALGEGLELGDGRGEVDHKMGRVGLRKELTLN